MKRPVLLLAIAVLAACGGADDPVPAEPVAAAPEPIRPGEVLSGQQAYERVCAKCHAEGIDGAPRTGDAESWAGRSQLWEAVLFEHARGGYIDMPPKGGAEALDDNTVSKAAEYMLMQTFPEARPSN